MMSRKAFEKCPQRFLAFVKDVLENTKAIKPATVEEGGKNTLAGWLERVLHKKHIDSTR